MAQHARNLFFSTAGGEDGRRPDEGGRSGVNASNLLPFTLSGRTLRLFDELKSDRRSGRLKSPACRAGNRSKRE